MALAVKPPTEPFLRLPSYKHTLSLALSLARSFSAFQPQKLGPSVESAQPRRSARMIAQTASAADIHRDHDISESRSILFSATALLCLIRALFCNSFSYTTMRIDFVYDIYVTIVINLSTDT